MSRAHGFSCRRVPPPPTIVRARKTRATRPGLHGFRREVRNLRPAETVERPHVPELPEVETTRRGIEPHVVGRRIQRLLVHERRLRWPVDPRLDATFAGTAILMAVGAILCVSMLEKDKDKSHRQQVRLVDPLLALRNRNLLLTSIGSAFYTAAFFAITFSPSSHPLCRMSRSTNVEMISTSWLRSVEVTSYA